MWCSICPEGRHDRPVRPLAVPGADIEHGYRLAAVAEHSGLNLIGVRDRQHVDSHVAFVFIGRLPARTRVTVLPDVANLPLRQPGTLARTSSSLTRVSGGRFVLGLGGAATGIPSPRWGHPGARPPRDRVRLPKRSS
ncbi:LLM class flavin-dependent oxidoreductase [Streptomyces sp. NBC_01497]|uniref:LLM class flavin-dependent oxidoreductase n=1 Tax=Streptomyces sp. NBC_01497 TaxID=2903885 RepID=UPI003FCE81D4